MRKLFTLTLLLLIGIGAQAQSITGRWTTVDDNSGKPRSVVEISERNGKVYGHIVDVFNEKERAAVCELCPAERRNKPIVGLEIIRDMARSGKEWTKGTILDPETGKVYDCKIWLEGGDLKVRGYVAFFFRTQTWVKDNK